MPKFACNISLLFTELDVPERFEAAANAGFKAVEYLFPYDLDVTMLQEQLAAHDLKLILCNAPPGNLSAGERGFAAIPGREGDFNASLDQALSFASHFSCPSVHVMAGITPDGATAKDCRNTFIQNLKRSASRAAEKKVTLLIEPLNNLDVPGYFLHYADEAARIIEDVNETNVRLQLDFYHAQMMRGHLADHIYRYLPITGHIQIAGVPGRHEPNIGEINYPYLFALLDNFGYENWIGCEYFPSGDTLAGLHWFHPYRALTVAS
jgi:hydroxypyruvate isomerase